MGKEVLIQDPLFSSYTSHSHSFIYPANIYGAPSLEVSAIDTAPAPGSPESNTARTYQPNSHTITH